jgi:hypothetical protein
MPAKFKDWSHVDHEASRQVLSGMSTNHDDIDVAFGYARECLSADENNPDVDHDLWSAREDLLNDGLWQWDDHHDTYGAITMLRAFWSL